MSDGESMFLKKLTLRLISIIGPFVIAGLIHAIVMIPQVRVNTQAIGKFDEGYVSRDVMMRYMEARREAERALLKAYDNTRVLNIEEHQIINKRIDDMLMREVYNLKQRGGELTVKTN